MQLVVLNKPIHFNFHPKTILPNHTGISDEAKYYEELCIGLFFLLRNFGQMSKFRCNFSIFSEFICIIPSMIQGFECIILLLLIILMKLVDLVPGIR